MKKTKKALASLAIAGMALTMVPFNAFATGPVGTRLSGNTAAQTAVAIADQTGWTADGSGNWTVSGLTLAIHDIISVTAQTTGLTVSATASATVQ